MDQELAATLEAALEDELEQLALRLLEDEQVGGVAADLAEAGLL